MGPERGQIGVPKGVPKWTLSGAVGARNRAYMDILSGVYLPETTL